MPLGFMLGALFLRLARRIPQPQECLAVKHARGGGHCFEKKSIWIAVEATKSGFDLSSILASKGLEDDCYHCLGLDCLIIMCCFIVLHLCASDIRYF
jgi:hypothetical protein